MLYNKSEIARKTGLSRQAISKVLNFKQENPRIQTLKKIAEVLGLKTWEFVKEIEEGEKNSYGN